MGRERTYNSAVDKQRARIAASMIDSVRWVRPVGQLDVAVCEELERVLRGDQSPAARLVYLDLAEVDFMDAAAIGAVVRAAHGLEAQGSALKVFGATGWVADLLNVTKISEVYGARLPLPEAELMRHRAANSLPSD